MAVCLGMALFSRDSASADRSVTISGSSIFYTYGDAEVWAHQELWEGDQTEDHELAEYYSMFVFKKGTDSVNYRKHLAYNWKYNSANEKLDKGATEASLVKEDGWFNMEIGFESYDFKKFVITFESQQYTQTKDGKTTNYVIFYPNEDKTGVRVVISGNIDDAPEDDTVPALKNHITIKFVKDKDIKDENAYALGPIQGVYNVEVSDSENSTSGKFENVGGTFAKYSSSTVTPVTPLSFKAEFDEDESAYARMIMYKLNGQSFRIGTYSSIRNDKGELKIDEEDFKANPTKYYCLVGREYVRNTTDTELVEGKDYYTYSTTSIRKEDGHFAGGTINDNAPPVLCLTNGVSHVGVGKELPFDYQLIDVLASSPSADTYYYMLTTEQESKGESFKADNYAEENLFRLVVDSDNQYMEPHQKHYIPTRDNGDELPVAEYDEENFEVVAAVKVYLKLYDTRTDSINQTTYVLLDWFVPAEKLVKVNGNYYIAVANDEEGVAFAYTSYNEETKQYESDPDSGDWAALKAAYQQLVTEAAKDIKAGSKNYFYLPSFENIEYSGGTDSLFSDNITAYKDLSFNVYYTNGSQSNTSSQTSSTLSINITKPGKYIFTIYATDKAGNPMRYYKKDGDKYEKKTFTASNIWSMYKSNKDTEYEDTKKYLPWFSFNVEAAKITIEDPGEREAAFVGTKYSSISFDISESSVKRTYELYRFDNAIYFNDPEGGNGKVAMTYEEFMERKAELLENNPEWFTEIPAASSLTKGSDEYDEFYAYGWNNTSPEFTPQDANTFYVVKITVKSTVSPDSETAYMGISCSAKIRARAGEDTWLEDNMTSIILLAIAGASLIGIVLLLVIKPKDKGDIDEQFEADKTKKKSKK